MELSQNVGHRDLVFIRFNPDEYTTNGVKVESRTKLGFLVIPKSKQAEWKSRLSVLKQTLEYWINNKTIETIELFYDTI